MSKTLTEVKNLLWELLIPNMRLLFMMQSPDKYFKWQGNCCRQAAMMTAMAMKYEYEREISNCLIIQSEFNGKIDVGNIFPVTKTWTHAYTKFKIGRNRYVIDMSLKQSKPIWFEYKFELGKHFVTDYPWHENHYMKSAPTVKSYSASSIDKLEDTAEYYTNLTMKQIYQICLNAKPIKKEILNELRSEYHFTECAG